MDFICRCGRFVAVASRKVANVCKNAAAVVVGGVITAGAITQEAAAQYTPPDLSTLDTVIDPSTLAAGALVLGGAALGAAFTVGGGFRIAKKAYSWVMNKI